MASLGELTAGIAHEIQNPLNFVNNFSEVSRELIEEMKEELATGSMQSAVELANNISQNLEKINHHGKRADTIVKSMLAHSRTSSGKKELTNLNVLAEEYLKLSYHGIKAKNKQFNASFKFEPDHNLPQISVVPQDIGRVLLNLINNAFYAVYERSKLNEPGYFPQVTLTTLSAEKAITIVVHDNGNGIPEEIKEKIFQPFFTTKPTGQGTGLGLSMAYDIIKAHEGTLVVESTEGEGSAFIISLPIYT
jgi:signal transduction histidine kinase